MSLSPVSQAAKEECDPSLFRQKKEEVLRLLRENPRINRKELAKNINEPTSTVHKILLEIRKERKEKVVELIGKHKGITIIQLMEIIGVSEKLINTLIHELKNEGRIERASGREYNDFYRILEEGEIPSSLEEQQNQKTERRKQREQKKERIVELIGKYKGITIRELAENIEVSEGLISKMIAELKDKERIERVGGSTNDGFYRILEEGETPLSLEEHRKQEEENRKKKAKKVVELIKKHKGITIKELAENMRVSEKAMGRIIRKLKDEKQIERVGGSGSSGFYRALEKS
ncbi:MAG: winged helix-turn-helix transcriptional regulator [Bdellovibrionales bacterium]|nr:winged helix-turn-helix transcriptional regulator [Bdellovibrionales bacterium]